MQVLSCSVLICDVLCFLFGLCICWFVDTTDATDVLSFVLRAVCRHEAALIAQLGERKTEDLEVPCSIHGSRHHATINNLHHVLSTQCNTRSAFVVVIVCAKYQ